MDDQPSETDTTGDVVSSVEDAAATSKGANRAKEELENAATDRLDDVDDIDETMEAANQAKDELKNVAADPVENNPITRADDVNEEVEHLRRVSRFLDSQLRIPGTSFRFGADSVIGLVPIGGDALTSVFSVYIVYKAYLLGISYGTIARMGINIVLDTVTGILPVIGDLLDIAWKANDRNMALLERRGNDLGSSHRDKWFAIIVVVSPILLVVAAVLGIAGVIVGVV